MNTSAFRIGALLIAGLLAFLALTAFFTVPQTQHAIVLRFGAVRSVISQPGLYLKTPFIENVTYVDKRVLDLDLPVQTILSTDRQNLEVDAFSRYRVIDPLRFYQAVNNVQNANARLTSFTNSAMRNVLANASTTDIVRTRRGELMNEIQEAVNRQSRGLGIEIVDVRLTRVDLPPQNSEAVYNRMRTERQREAADLRANGQREAQSIRARAEREATVIVAEAGRRSEELRGQGDAERNRILAEAFQRDPDFFSFYRSMQAYEAGFRPGDTRLVLSPNSDFLRYFTDPMGRNANGAAQPRPPGAPVAPPPGPQSAAPAPAPAASVAAAAPPPPVDVPAARPVLPQ